MGINTKNIVVLIFVSILSIHLTDCDNIRLPDQIQNNEHIEERRQGKHLLDFVGLGTGSNVDPYLAKTNGNCLNGELADCFKSQALSVFNDFFNKESYNLAPFARVIRMPDYQLRSLEQEPYEYSTEPRAADSEWDSLVKYALRKVEKFLKSTAFEIQIPQEFSEGGRYSPRFVDEISDEIDVLEDKKAPIFNRNRLKKLFIPLLIILKLFKLKLLLFLPLILGLASFKKLLGFMAIIIPGVIGYFKLCHPQNNYANNQQNGYYPYSPQGLGSANYHHQNHHQQFGHGGNYYINGATTFTDPYTNYYREGQQSVEPSGSGGSVRFGDSNAQNLAYQGYSEYRNKNVEKE